MKRLLAPLLIAASLMAVAFSAQAKGLDTPALEAWLQKYGAAWEGKDPAAAGKIFTADATYHENVYEPVMQGRAAIEKYWGTVTADQRDIKFESKVIAVNGNTGVAHWSATFKLASTGATIALDGVFVLEFDASGQCKSLREWWFVKAS
jgi:steroid Delta-isomerase